jgi:type I restriction enzyme S subunit
VIEIDNLPAVPASWSWDRAKNVCVKIQDGTHFSPKNQKPYGKYKYVTAKNIRPWGMNLSDVTYLDEHDHRSIYERCDPKKGDVLLVKDGVNTGDAALNTLDEEFSLLSSVCLLRPDRRVIEGAFLRYFLQSPIGYQSLIGQMSGTAIKRIVLHRIRDLPVPIAPLPEQRRIVAEIETQLTRLDAAVAALERARANLKRYRAATLEKSLGKFSHERGSAVWTCDTLGNLAIQSGYGTSVKCSYEETNEPVLRIPNVVRGRVDLADMKNASRPLGLSEESALQPGDLLMVRTNGSIDLVGRTAVLNRPLSPFHGFASYLLRFRFDQSRVLADWVHLFLSSPTGRKFLERHAASSAGQHNVSLSMLGKMPIPLPSKEEQRAIIQETERRLSVVADIEATIDANQKRAERMRQSLLRKAFSGQLVPQDPSDEPASVLLARICAERAAKKSPKKSARKGLRSGQPLLL